MRKFSYFLFISAICYLLSADCLHSQPQIRLSKVSWSIGKVTEGKVLDNILLIENSGDRTLSLRARSSCECITLSFNKKDIKPEKQVKLKITYDTKGDTGEKTEYIFLDSNDPEYPHLTWVIEADVEKKEPNAVTIYMFSTPNCGYCLKLKEKIIPDIARKNNLKIDLIEYLLSKPENYEKLILWEKEYSDTSNKIPVIFLISKVLGGKKEIKKNLEAELLNVVAGSKRDSSSVIARNQSLQRRPKGVPRKARELERRSNLNGITSNERKEIVRKFKSIKILPVLGAGLIDGINPCAFGAIIFLITYLSVIIKKKKKEIFFTGISFATGVFITYFFLGLGLSEILHTIKGFVSFARILYFLIGILTLILAILSFKDYCAMVNKKKSISLKLPDSLRWKIFKVFEKHTKVKYFVIFAFFTGIIISCLELVCTGQIYLPTIMYMIQTTVNRQQAIGYLLFYSFMFIIPLLLVFFLYIWGVRSQKLSALEKKHFQTVKIFNTLVFLFFSGYMLAVAFGLL